MARLQVAALCVMEKTGVRFRRWPAWAFDTYARVVDNGTGVAAGFERLPMCSQTQCDGVFGSLAATVVFPTHALDTEVHR